MLLLIFRLLLPLLHPFYVSVTEINHNASDQSLEISIRIFTDDFENTLRMHHPDMKVDLMNPPEGGAMDSLIKNYHIQRLKLEVNGSVGKLQYVGFERIGESIWSYFEVARVPLLQELKIHNPILYEYKKEQINMVHVNAGKKQQSRKLDNPKADWVFRF